jgi:hypothetical protein
MRAPEWWSWYWGLSWIERRLWTALAVALVAGIVEMAFSREGRIVLGLFLTTTLLVVLFLRLSRKDGEVNVTGPRQTSTSECPKASTPEKPT